MNFPVQVQTLNAEFAASVIGAPEIRGVGKTRSAAVAALKQEIERMIDSGELLSLEIEPVGFTALAGTLKDDPTLDDICKEAYRLRDQELHDRLDTDV